MLKKSLLLMLLMALFAPWAAKAQTLGDYTFSTGTDASKWVTVTSTESLLVNGQDSQASSVLNIGFNFPFGENTYDKFSVNTDGNLRLGNTATGTSAYSTPFSSSNANNNNPKINAFGCDGYATANNYVKYQNESDKLVVEFCMNTYSQRNTTTLKFKWQIHLYTNGDIEIVFPDTDELPETNPTVSHQCGLCMNSSDGWIITSTDNTATHFTNGSSTYNASGSWFDANRYYRFEAPVYTCFKPQNLQASLTPGNGSIATLTWQRHANGTENAWVLQYGTDNTFATYIDQVTVNTNPTKDLTGLTSDQTYYARVKPDCDTDGSLWSNVCEFTPTDSYTITLNDGTNTNACVPVYGLYSDYSNRSQFIIPSGDLTSLQWATFDKLTFYAGTPSADFGTEEYTVYMKEVEYTTFSSTTFTDWNSLYSVYVGTITVSGNKMVINLDTPYTYSGGNLLIGFQETVYGSQSPSFSWYGVNQATGSYTAIYQKASSSHTYTDTPSRVNFLPKVTIDYTPGTPPTCLTPTALGATEDQSDRSVLSWTDNNGTAPANGWTVYYKKTTDASYSSVSAPTNPFTLTGLTAATNYQYYVVANCSGSDESNPSQVFSFQTACGVLSGLNESFDSYAGASSGATNNLPLCWNYINTSSNSTYKGYPVIYNYSSSSHSGNNHLRFLSYYYSSTSDAADQYAILPAIENINGMRIKMYARANNTSTASAVYDATFHVGVMSDPADASSFVEIGSGYTPASTTYELFTIPFNTYTGNGTYIAIKVEAAGGSASYTSYYNSVFIDDIVVEEIPSCVEPTGLAVVTEAGNPGTHSVKLQWTAATGTSAWDVYCTTSNVAPTAETTPTVTGTTDNPCTISGLTSSSHYYAYVRTRCSETTQSSWSDAVEFDTECESVTTFPWTENFEGMTANTVPMCWDNSATTGTDYSSHPEYYWGVYSYNGNKMIRMYNYFAHGPLAIINSPTIVLPAEAKELTFDYTHTASSGAFSVKISEDGGTTFTELDSYSKGSSSGYEDPGTFTEATISLADYANKSVILQFYSAANYGSGAIFVDNIRIDNVPTCIKPSALKCDSKTAHTATLSWTNGAATQDAWQIAYSTTADFDPATVTPVDATTNPATIEGLAQSTTYYAYVRANCGNDDYSAWCNTKVSFTTLAGNVTPTGLAVDASTITSSQATASWNAVAGNTLHQSYDIYWAPATVTAVPDEPAAPNLISGITATSQVITGLDPETDYKVWVRDNCGTDGLSAWSSAVNFSTVSACQTPDGLQASEVTEISAKITWNTYGQTGFNLRYSSDGGTSWTDKPNVNSSYTIDGLTANTPYQVQVQATCNTAEWSTTLSFRTECGAMTITAATYLQEGFEDYTATAYNVAGMVPYCWDSYSTGTSYPYPHVVSGTSYNYTHAGSSSLNFIGESYEVAYVALPVFTNDLNTLMVNFWMRTEGTGDYKLSLGYITSEDNNYNTYQVIEEYDNTTTVTERTTYLGLKNVPSTATRLVFRWNHPTNSWHACCIDDVVVKLSPSCYPVGTLSYDNATISSSSVKLSWTLVDNTQDEWTVQYATNATFTEGVATKTATTNTNYELTGLTPETPYWVRVKAACSTTDDWSNAVNFTTLEACPTPSGLTATNLTQISSNLKWTASPDVTAYTVQFRTAATMALDGIDEDFEDGVIPDGWTIEGDNQVSSKTWRIGTGDYNTTTGAHNSSYNALITHNTDGEETYLVTPNIDLSGQSGLNVNLWYINRTWGTDNDGFGVYYRVNGGEWNEIFATTSAHSTWTEVDEALPAGAYAANCQFGFKFIDNFGYGVGIDDIVIGSPTVIPEGSWTTATTTAPNTGAYTLEGLSAGIKYNVRVYAECATDPETANATVTFNTLANGNKVFAGTDGDWSNANNWIPSGVPELTDDVIIRANVTVPANTTALANNITFEGTTTPTLTIADGGQLQHSNNITATVKKNVVGYTTANALTNNGYILLASPLVATYGTNPNDVGLITDDNSDPANRTYDLYGWSGSATTEEWRNYRTTSFNLYNGYGYLYANVNNVGLTFTGTIKASNEDVTMNPTYGDNFNAWNLYGNPFVCDAYLNDASDASMAFYRMNSAYVMGGDEDTYIAATGAIAPMEGIFVKTTAASQSFNFSRTQKSTSRGQLNVNLGKDSNSLADNAIVRFDGGNTLEKFSFREGSTKVYIPVEGKDYAVVSAEEQGEIPVSFKAETNGNYTLSFTAEDVQFSYLHLIDNLTGNDVDLLVTPSYSFDARFTDYASRFKLVFCKASTDMGDTFAFISDGNIIINGADANTTVQIIDALGRILVSRGNGVRTVSTDGLTPGVYVIRLIQGENTRTQKIVVG